MEKQKQEVTVLHAEDAFAVCVKPVGVASEGENGMPGLLSRQLGGDFFPVHRLDQAVGGVMLLARSAEAAARFSTLIQAGKLRKEYLAVLGGVPQEREGELCDLLFHDRAKNKTYVVGRKRAGVKQARLGYTVLDVKENRSLVLVRLYTGRTHQIRAQFASRGLPLVGDGKYGSRDKAGAPALWSYRLTVNDRVYEALPEGEAWEKFSLQDISGRTGSRTM